jgi:dTDP-4-dehydrorhamnose 3,5-epimerase
MLSIRPLKIEGAFILEGELFNDNRGVFRELMKMSDLKSIDNLAPWVQNNVSISIKNSIRGIHFSSSSNKQNKLISCLNGSIRDFIVDIRKDSPTFGDFCEVTLQSNTATSVYIEGGLGHAFIAQNDNCVVSYLLSAEYNPSNEFGINPFDPTIKINWGVSSYHISEKDKTSPNLNEAILSGILPRYNFS